MHNILLLLLFPLLAIAAPNNPSDLVLTPERTSVHLSWRDQSDNESGFKIFRNKEYITTLPKNTTQYTDRGLQPHTTYNYTVKATNDETNFILGVNIGSTSSVTIDENRWLSEDVAEENGMLISSAQALSNTSTDIQPTPAVDTEMYTMLNSVRWAKKDWNIKQPIPNGTYSVSIWIMENYKSHNRKMDISVEGQTKHAIGNLAKTEWKKYTYSNVTVNDETLDILLHGDSDVHMMGFEVLGQKSIEDNDVLKGTNFAGGEFENAIFPKANEMDKFIDKGMNIFRLPFRWESLQPKLNASLDTDYLKSIKEYVTHAKSKGVKIVLDLHDYACYKRIKIAKKQTQCINDSNRIGGNYANSNDDDNLVKEFSDVWRKLAIEFKDNDNVVFGLMNEPHDIKTAIWLNAVNKVIATIRKTGAKNLILVPGTHWTGGATWTENDNNETMGGVQDSLNNYAFEIHQYFDEEFKFTNSEGEKDTDYAYSGTYGKDDTCANIQTHVIEKLIKLTKWLKAKGKKGFIGEMGIPNNNSGCKNALNKVLQYIQNNKNQWLGWTYWASGSSFSPSYHLFLDVNSPKMDVLSNFLEVNSPANTDTISSINGPETIQTGQTITVNIEYETEDKELSFALQGANDPWDNYFAKRIKSDENGHQITFTVPNIPEGTPLMYQAYLTPKGKGWADRVAVKWQNGIKIDNYTKDTWLKRTPIPQTNYSPASWSLGEVYTVKTWEQYQEAFKTVKAGDLVWFPAGTKIEVNPDKSGYDEGFIGIHGTADKKIYLSTDIDNPAVISEGRIPIHFRDDCSYIEISNIKIDRAAERGIQLGLVAREEHGPGGEGVAKTILGTVSHIDIINVELTHIGNAAIAISSAHNINVLDGSIHGTFGALKEAEASEGIYIGDGNYVDKSEEEYELRLDNHHIVIRGMDIYDRGSEAIDLKARSREVLIEENHIWNVGRRGEWNPAIVVMWRDYDTLNHQGNYNSNIMIRRNHIHNCGGYGIAIGSGGGNVIESNIIHDGLSSTSGVKNGIEIRQTFQPNYNRLSIRNNTIIRHNKDGGSIKYNTYKHTDYKVSSPSVGPQLFKTGQNLVDGSINRELLGSNSREHVDVNQFIGPTKDAADAHGQGESPSGSGSGFTLKPNTTVDIAPTISDKDYRGINLLGTSRIGAINLLQY